MELYKVRDIVREEVGRDRLSDPMLDWCIEQGLREMEKVDNWYWMQATPKTGSLTASQQSYLLTGSTSNGFNLPDWKANKFVSVTTGTALSEVRGPVNEDISTLFTTTATGLPLYYSLQNVSTPTATIVFWPNPDTTYAYSLAHYQWTALPTDITTDTHEVLKRWPEALIALATEQAILQATKDAQAAGVFGERFRSLWLPQIRATEPMREVMVRGHRV